MSAQRCRNTSPTRISGAAPERWVGSHNENHTPMSMRLSDLVRNQRRQTTVCTTTPQSAANSERRTGVLLARPTAAQRSSAALGCWAAVCCYGGLRIRMSQLWPPQSRASAILRAAAATCLTTGAPRKTGTGGNPGDHRAVVENFNRTSHTMVSRSTVYSPTGYRSGWASTAETNSWLSTLFGS